MAGFEQIEALDKVCIDENVTSGRSCSALMLTTSISGYSPTPAAWIARWLCIHALRLVMGGACLGSLFAAGGRLAAPHLLQLQCHSRCNSRRGGGPLQSSTVKPVFAHATSIDAGGEARPARD